LGCKHVTNRKLFEQSLIKTQINRVFWLRGDLNFVNNKNIAKQHQGFFLKRKNKRTIISIKNDKMTINILTRVSKRHVRNTKANRRHLEIEGQGPWIPCSKTPRALIST
jgi:hypothetical protein